MRTLTRRVVFVAPLLGLAACSADPRQEPSEQIAAADGALSTTCVVLKRGGAGDIADAEISAKHPDKPNGAESIARVGQTGGGERQTLLRADTSPIPASAAIVSATLTLSQSNEGEGTLGLHRALSPWDEATVTWSGFAGGFDPAVVASVDNGGASHDGAVSFDVTSLVKQWVEKQVPNHGVLLAQDGSKATKVRTSEHEDAALRPRFEVCYRPAVEPQGTSLLVQVLDVAGAPLSSAVVTAQDGQPHLTDGAGYVVFEDLVPGRFSARVDRWGYAPASVVVDLPAGIHGGAEARLLPLPPPIPFNAEEGAVLDAGPVHVEIPPGALVDYKGDPVTGPVEATIVPLDPTQGLAGAPGPLEGIAQGGGATVSLESLLMAEVTLWQGVQPVQLAPGSTALLELVLPDAVAAQVQLGEAIPAWYFDLDAGIWIQEGQGHVQGSLAEPGKLSWVAEVSHFSWWNCDRPWTNKHCFLMNLTAADGSVFTSGLPVQAVGTSYIGASSGYSDGAGRACLETMRDGAASISVGLASAPAVTLPVTGSGPAADCAGNGVACVELSITVPENPLCTPGTSVDCGYSGPAGTLGVGACKAARSYCNTTGTGWSGCGGEVLPQPETCATPSDDDCDGLTNEEGLGCACSPGSKMPCYTGRSGTLGVGICAAGARTCKSGFFGACQGEVTPQIETCATAQDENCDGSTDCRGMGIWSKGFWSKGFLAPNQAYASSAAVDSADNVVTAGSFTGSVDFGGGPLTSAGDGYDIYVTKFDTNGNHIWSRRFGDASNQYALATAFDSTGNVVLGGGFSGMVDFGGGPLTNVGPPDVFVAKLDASGNHLWSKRFGDAANLDMRAPRVDGAGNVVLAGGLRGTVDFGGGPLTSASNYDSFVAKLDASGNHLWSKRFGNALSFQSPGAVGVDSAGNTVIAGTFSGTADFGGGPLTTAGFGGDIFVVKLDASGNHVWSKRFGDGDSQGASGAAVDSAGNITITGESEYAVDFGGGPVVSVGYGYIFVARFDASGNHIWSKNILAGEAGDRYVVLASDSAGNVVLTGNGGPFPNDGDDYHVFVAKFDVTGNHVWSKRFGGTDFSTAAAAAFDSGGNILLTGSYVEGSMDFGNGPIANVSGGRAVFLAKLTP